MYLEYWKLIWHYLEFMNTSECFNPQFYHVQNVVIIQPTCSVQQRDKISTEKLVIVICSYIKDLTGQAMVLYCA